MNDTENRLSTAPVRACGICGKTQDLRPYGKNGSDICFTCAMKPENLPTAEAHRNRYMQRAAIEGCGLVVIGDGPPAPYVGQPVTGMVLPITVKDVEA